MWNYEEQFRKDKPDTIGETDKHFDLDNYKDWLESKLENAVDLLRSVVDLQKENYGNGMKTHLAMIDKKQ